MATTINDLKLYYSGGKKDLDVISESYLSLGGYRRSVTLPNAVNHNLFEEVTVGDAYDGIIDFRCIYLRNNHLSLPMMNLKLYIADKKDYEKIEFGVAIPTSNTGYVQLLNRVDEQPYGVTFYEAYTIGDAVVLKSSIASQEMLALYFRRTIKDYLTLKTEYEIANPGLTFTKFLTIQTSNW